MRGMAGEQRHILRPLSLLTKPRWGQRLRPRVRLSQLHGILAEIAASAELATTGAMDD
jgi:hypothetical protein